MSCQHQERSASSAAESQIILVLTRTSPFKVLCNGLICSLLKSGGNVRVENRNATRAGV